MLNHEAWMCLLQKENNLQLPHIFLEIESHAIRLAGNCGQIVKIIDLRRLPREVAPCRLVNSCKQLCFMDFLVLKMEKKCFFETPVTTHQSTWRHVPKYFVSSSFCSSYLTLLPIIPKQSPLSSNLNDLRHTKFEIRKARQIQDISGPISKIKFGVLAKRRGAGIASSVQSLSHEQNVRGIVVQFPVGTRNFSLSQSFHIGYGAPTTSY